jgi:hypothetical protein
VNRKKAVLLLNIKIWLTTYSAKTGAKINGKWLRGNSLKYVVLGDRQDPEYYVFPAPVLYFIFKNAFISKKTRI